MQGRQKFLDEAKDGVTQFSLRASARTDQLPEKWRDCLLAFSEVPHKILWKWELDSLPGQPANVNVAKWRPHQDTVSKIAHFSWQHMKLRAD